MIFSIAAGMPSGVSTRPTEVNYVSATNSRGLELKVSFDDVGHTRPWYQALHVLMPYGHLDEGDTIDVVLGDRSQGSPGLKVQSCAIATGLRKPYKLRQTAHAWGAW